MFIYTLIPFSVSFVASFLFITRWSIFRSQFQLLSSHTSASNGIHPAHPHSFPSLISVAFPYASLFPVDCLTIGMPLDHRRMSPDLQCPSGHVARPLPSSRAAPIAICWICIQKHLLSYTAFQYQVPHVHAEKAPFHIFPLI